MKIKNVKHVLDELKETDEELLKSVEPFWQEAMTAGPQNGVLPFLEPAHLKNAREYAGFPADLDAEMENVACKIRENENLRLLSLYIDWRNFEASDRGSLKWPDLEKTLGEQAGVFWLIMSLAWIPRLVAYHQSLDIPEDITRATARQVYSFSLNYKMATQGRPGIFNKQYYWFRNYLADNLYFRIGRFEYWLKPFELNFMVFRHRQSGVVLALAGDGIKTTRDGFIDGLCDEASGGEWTTTLFVDGKEAKGHVISPRGFIKREATVLPLSEWVCVLKKGDWVLDNHIPAGGNMSHEKCADSIQRAFAFFGERWPDKKPSAIVCGTSWMFSPLLEKALPSTSNLVKYLRELYLFPVAGGGTSSLWFMFFQDTFNPATAPRETSLQRAMLEYLKDGKIWHNGGMFILPEDADKFGLEYYRGSEHLFPAEK